MCEFKFISCILGHEAFLLAKHVSSPILLKAIHIMDRDGEEVHKLAKKERRQYPAILNEQAWSMKDLSVVWFKGKFFLWDTAGCPERAR